jgi:hypothetical protein
VISSFWSCDYGNKKAQTNLCAFVVNLGERWSGYLRFDVMMVLLKNHDFCSSIVDGEYRE